MESNKNINIDLFKSVNLNDEEKAYINSVLDIDNQEHNMTVLQKKTAFSILYLAKQIEASSKSNDRHSKAMKWLTFALLIASAVQAVSAVIQLCTK